MSMLALLASFAPVPPAATPSQGSARAIAAYVGTRNIGLHGLGIAPVGDHFEIFASGHGVDRDYWYAMRREADGSWSPFHATILSASHVRRFALANVTGGAELELVLAREDGRIEIFDTVTKRPVHSFFAWSEALELADVDGDSLAEIVVSTSASTQVFDAGGNLLYNIPGLGSYALAVGQLDADAGVEIVLASGHVIDLATQSVQCTRPGGFGPGLVVSNVDGDSQEEIVFANSYTAVDAWDADTCQLLWSMPVFIPGRLAALDVDGDGKDELLIDTSAPNALRAYDPATQQLLWTVPHPENGASEILLADVDQDGADELVWSAGLGTSGPDHLYVVDAATRAIEWTSLELDGPWIGPELGDLDGDGSPELVVGIQQTESDYEGGRVLALEPGDFHRRGLSPIVGDGSIYSALEDVRLCEIDGTPGLEILVGTQGTNGALVDVWDMAVDGTFTRLFGNGKQLDQLSFAQVDAGDLDGDGDLELVGGTRIVSVPKQASAFYVFDAATTLEAWRSSIELPYLHYHTSGLELAQTDADPALEIVFTIVNGDTYVVDGATRQVEAHWTGSFRALTTVVDPATGLEDVVAGDYFGSVARWRFTGSGYTSLGVVSATSGNVDGLDGDRVNSIFVSSPTALSLQAPLGSANTVWSLTGFGPTFGRRVVRAPQFGTLFASGDFGVFALRER